MTLQDWLSLSSAEDHYGELAAVVQPRKLFQLGIGFLTRVWDLLPAEAVRTAAETTRDYIAGRVRPPALLLAWSDAEAATSDGMWSNYTAGSYRYWCPCCEPYREEDIRLGVKEGIRNPAWFAARAAWLAVDLVGDSAPAKRREKARQKERAAQWPLALDVLGDQLAEERPSPVPSRHGPVPGLLAVIDRQELLDPLILLALADAAEEAGCVDAGLLAHLRDAGPHFRGCWAIERLAGREMIHLPVDDEAIWPLGRDARDYSW
jgi:hypothetical protein